MSMKNLEDLFVEELKDIYDAERRITKALPKMSKAASHEDLITAFQEHLQQTEEHISRLESVFASLGKTPGRKTCQAMVGLLAEGQSIMDEDATESVMDAALIAAAQKVEHYEMATYGCLRTWATVLGNEDAAKLLQETLDEEGDADKKLTEISQSLNFEAAEGEEEEEEEEEEEMQAVGTGKRSNGGTRSNTGARSNTGTRSTGKPRSR